LPTGGAKSGWASTIRTCNKGSEHGAKEDRFKYSYLRKAGEERLLEAPMRLEPVGGGADEVEHASAILRRSG